MGYGSLKREVHHELSSRSAHSGDPASRQIARKRALQCACMVQDVHGTANIPPGYRNAEEPSWAEAGKWLARQAHLFNKGKLTPLRAIIIRETLGAPQVLVQPEMQSATEAS